MVRIFAAILAVGLGAASGVARAEGQPKATEKVPEKKDAEAPKDAELPAPAIVSLAKEPLTTLAIANLQTGNKVFIMLKDSLQGIPQVSGWTLYIVDAGANEIKWSKTGKGAPPEPIEWDGLFDDGTYPVSGKVYSFKAVLQGKGGARKTKAKDLTASLVSSDFIEIAEVAQRAGAGLCSLKVKGGSTLSSVPCFSAASRVYLGSLVSLDAWFMRNLDSTKQPVYDGQKLDGTFTFGSVSTSLRYHVAAVDLQAGASFLFEKVSFSPDREEKERLRDEEPGTDPAKVSGSLQSSAGRVAVRYGGTRLLAGIEALAGVAKSAAGAAVGLSADYVLSPSWFAGGEVQVVTLGPSRGGDPGLNFASVLLHVGFDVKRGSAAR